MIAGALLAFGMGYTDKRPTTFIHRLIFFACLTATLLTLIWALGSGIYYRFLI
jgi:hypothetical protein